MKHIYYLAGIVLSVFVTSCSPVTSGGSGITDTEITTITHSFNEYDLEVDSQGVTYTIDISTPEGALKLENLTLPQAKELALQEAAIKNNCARLISPKFSHLMKGKHVLRITVFGFPARYKNSSIKEKMPEENVIIVK